MQTDTHKHSTERVRQQMETHVHVLAQPKRTPAELLAASFSQQSQNKFRLRCT